MNIYTGNYDNCKIGNLVSISGDKGKSVGYIGNSYMKLAPKLSFWKEWHNNIGVLSEEENNRFYMEKYYETVLKYLDAREVLLELSRFGEKVILLCYEPNGLFCHRHLIAAWLELELNIAVHEVAIMADGQLKLLDNQNSEKDEFKEMIKKLRKEKILIKKR